MNLKYLYGTIILGCITLYSYLHSEKYHVLMPIIFGALTVISLSILLGSLTENKQNKQNKA